MNYEEDLRIDETALDVEWLEQPSLLQKYSKYYAECEKKVMLADEEVKLVRSELIKQANEDPDRYLGDGVKPTGPNIEAYYRNHKKHKDAKQKWIDAQFELNLAKDAKDNISFNRKAALENLVVLHNANYFAGPSVPRNLSEERKKLQEKKERVDTGIAKKMRRTK